MKRPINLTRRVRLSFIAAIHFAVTLLGVLWFIVDFQGFKSDLVQIEAELIESYKSYAQQEVNEAIYYIENKRQQVTERTSGNLKAHVSECIAVAQNIYDELESTTPLPHIKNVIREALRPVSFFDNREGCLFALSMDGISQLNPEFPNLEGTNLQDRRDATGEFLTRKEINLITSQGFGYVTSTWELPDGSKTSEKITYIEYFEPLDWYFGTGIYVADIENKVKNEVLTTFSQMKLQHGGYIFLGSYDGTSVLGPNAGENMLDYVDDRGVHVVRELISLAKDGGGFLMYKPPMNLDFPYTTKVSYVRGIEEWEWYLGAGVQIENIDAAIKARTLELKQDIRTKLFVIIAVYLIVLVLSVVYWAILSKKVSESVRVFTEFFERAASTHLKIDEENLPYKEARDIAVHANTMVDEYVQITRDLLDKENAVQKAERLESLGVLAGGIAHDFNNLLSVILGNISLVQSDSNLDHEIVESLEDAESATLQARDLATQLLTFSKGGAPVKQPVDLGGFLKKVVEFALKGSNVSCQFEIDENLLPVEIDPAQFSQLINNLIINAQQAMPAGGVVRISAHNDRCFTVSRKSTSASVVIVIADDGPGIDEEHIDSIFDPYFTTKDAGSGLGLATVHSIVTKHDGMITAESGPEGGTTFSICLPASATSIADANSTGSRLDAAETHMSRRVLLMDDDDRVRATASKMLRKLRFEVSVAINGEEAVGAYIRALAFDAPFDIVLLDLTVQGGMGGLHCMKMLQDIDPSVCAIVTSGYSEGEVLSRPDDFGFKAALRKPFKIEDLERALRNVSRFVSIAKDATNRGE